MSFDCPLTQHRPQHQQSFRLVLARMLEVGGRFYMMLLIPVLIFLYLKYQMLYANRFGMCAACCGSGLDPGQVSDWEAYAPWWIKVSFFREDLAFCFVFLPLLVLILVAFLPRVSRVPLFAVTSIFLTFIFVVEIRAFWVTGRYLSKELIFDSIRFAANNSEVASAYVDRKIVFRLVLVLVPIVPLGWWAWRGNRTTSDARPPQQRSLVLLGGGYVGLLATTLVAWLPQVEMTRFHRGTTWFLFTSLLGEQVDKGEFANLPPDELVQNYRDLTSSPAPKSAPEYWAQAKDCDVILFILETAPARCLDLAGDLTDFPNLAQLTQRSWIATRHHTTYPFTNRAVFSILSSWYPSRLMTAFPARYPNRHFPGLIQTLHSAGYVTGLYVPDPFTRFADDSMYTRLGFDHRVYTQDEGNRRPTDSLPKSLAQRIDRDRAALKRLKEDMAHWHKTDQRFASIFLPQIGHGPWPDLTGNLPSTDMAARGRAIITIQDGWLGELIEQLKQAGRLDKTLIVVAGDHGVRSATEDPRNFSGGTILDYTFHVPLLVFAPTILKEQQLIPYVTSHIDVAPSLLDLLGFVDGRGYEQGSPIWDTRLEQRTIFLWGDHYLGADGFIAPASCGMQNSLTDSLYVAPTLAFDRNRPLTSRDPAYAELKLKLQRMAALQETWATLPDPAPARVKPD